MGPHDDLVPFTMTLVHYRDGDVLGLGLALITLSPVFMVVSYVTLLFALRFPARLVSVFIGQMLNVGLNLLLKRVFRQDRPLGRPHLLHFGRYGMPSNHSQFMFFSAAIALMNLISSRPTLVAYPKATQLGVIALAFAVAYSRIYLEYHSFDQVFMGSFVGAALGFLWFYLDDHIQAAIRRFLAFKRKLL